MDENTHMEANRVRIASAVGVVACLAVFGALRAALLVQEGELGMDRWVADRLDGVERETPLAELAERIAAAPGTRKGALLLIIAIAMWAWLRRRDLRWGLLVTTSFVCATATVELFKLGAFDPIVGELERTYLSAHAANVTSVAGMVLVMAAFAHLRSWLLVVGAATATILVAMVSVAMMIGEHHFLTDIVGGIAIAGAWVCVLTPAANEMWRRPGLIRALVRDTAGEPGAHPDRAAEHRGATDRHDADPAAGDADASATGVALDPDGSRR